MESANKTINLHAGGTYITTLKGKLWPVVLCSDEVAPPLFIAMRQDPTFLPAIQLGRQKYIWVRPDMLKEIDPDKNYLAGLRSHEQLEIQPGDSEALVEEKRRRKAFREDARHYHNHHFWANYINNRSEMRKLGIQKRQQNISQKRRRVSVIDLEEDVRHASWSTPAKRQKFIQSRAPVQPPMAKRIPSRPSTNRRHDSINDAIEISDGDSDSDESDDDELFVSPLKRKGKGPVRMISDDANKVYQSIELDDPFVSQSEPAPPGPHQCKLLFPKGGSLVVEKEVISNCQFLLSRRCDDEHATELDLSHDKRAKEANLHPSDISAVISYFRNGDLGPRFVNKAGDPPALAALDLTTKKKEAHAETLSKAFVAGVKIQDEDLQELVCAKLRALSPLSPISAIIVAKSIASLPAPTTETQTSMSTLATSCLVQCFWALARDCGEMLQNLLEENEAMRMAIFDALKATSQRGKMGFDS